MNQWDIIGDIHGYAEALEGLLRKMGYQKRRGRWQRSGARVLFLGDYVNRGPEIPEAVNLVRSMVEAGNAVALLGNHDFNLVRVFDGGLTGHESELARKLVRQAADSLVAYGGSRRRLREALAWLRELPLVWEDEGFRAVHACWDEGAVTCLLRTGGPVLGEEDFSSQATGPRQRAIDVLLNGTELRLPRGLVPERGNLRVRTKWWLSDAATWKEAAYPEEPNLPEEPLPAGAHRAFRPYAPDWPPVFFGHYGFPKPSVPVLPNAACLDFAMARGGTLGGYRWDGERKLRRNRFILLD
ncbi:MAG: metallophosphoesterase [Candidatus Methylacidiphilales bacterium]